MAFCKSCNAVIEWHKTAEGRNIPLDPEPHQQGNLTFDSAMRVVYMRPGSKPRMYRSHFATCPNAAQHRKPRASTVLDRAIAVEDGEAEPEEAPVAPGQGRLF